MTNLGIELLSIGVGFLALGFGVFKFLSNAYTKQNDALKAGIEEVRKEGGRIDEELTKKFERHNEMSNEEIKNLRDRITTLEANAKNHKEGVDRLEVQITTVLNQNTQILAKLSDLTARLINVEKR